MSLFKGIFSRIWQQSCNIYKLFIHQGIKCCELLVIIDRTIMHSNILHSQYVLQAESLQEQLS